MNSVNLIGIIDGDAELVYENNENHRNLYHFILRITKPFKNKYGEVDEDTVNVKIWSGNLEDESMLHDQATIAIEGRIQSYQTKETKSIYNEVMAYKIHYLG